MYVFETVGKKDQKNRYRDHGPVAGGRKKHPGEKNPENGPHDGSQQEHLQTHAE
jgi:hypothetical protein